MQPTNNLDAETLKTHQTVFFLNFQKRDPMQITNMGIALIGFCEMFGKKTKKEVELTRRIMADPIKYVLENFPDFFSSDAVKKRMAVKKSLGSIDWIYYRDTTMANKLTKEYPTDATKPKVKMITLEGIIDIVTLVKMEFYRILTKVARENNVPLEIVMPFVQEQQIKQVGLDGTR